MNKKEVGYDYYPPWLGTFFFFSVLSFAVIIPVVRIINLNVNNDDIFLSVFDLHFADDDNNRLTHPWFIIPRKALD